MKWEDDMKKRGLEGRDPYEGTIAILAYRD